MGYRTIETHLSPPNSVTGVEDFKDLVEKETDKIIEARKAFAKQENTDNEEVPFPICIYVLFQDFSIQKAMLFPTSNKEKHAMIMSVKEQIANPDPILIKTPAIYGAFVSEVYMTKVHREEDGKFHEEEKLSRMLFHFEQKEPTAFECKLYSIIDPGILSYEEKESEMLTKVMNSDNIESMGPMSSIFDWTPEQQLDIIGKRSTQPIETFNLKSAISFVQEMLKKKG